MHSLGQPCGRCNPSERNVGILILILELRTTHQSSGAQLAPTLLHIQQ